MTKENATSPQIQGAIAGNSPSDQTPGEAMQAISPQQIKEVIDPLTRVFPSPPVAISCREELDPILQRHQKWIASVMSPRSDILEGRANLAGADLSGFDLTGVNLSGATLTGSKLVGALFRSAILKGADFTGSNAQGADFSGAKLQRAKFERADLRDSEFGGSDTTGADFRFARRGSIKDGLAVVAEDQMLNNSNEIEGGPA